MSDKRIWRSYERIPDVDWIYMAGIMLSFTGRLSKYGIKSSINNSLIQFSDLGCEFYFYPDQYSRTQADIIRRVYNNPEWGLKYNQKLRKSIDRYFAVARKINRKDLSKLSNAELSDWWEKLVAAKEDSHARGVVTTWIIDASDQPFTHALTETLAKKITEKNLRLSPSKTLATLTIPLEISSIQEEEIESLKMYQDYLANGTTKAFQKRLENFAARYGWLFYKYIGPAKTVTDYQKDFQNYQERSLNPVAGLAKIAQSKKDARRKQRDLAKRLELNDKEIAILAFAREIILLKDYRKASQFYGCMINEKILQEIANRLSLSLRQVRNFMPWEIKPALVDGVFDALLLNERNKLSIMVCQDKDFQVFIGREAQDVLARQNFEEIPTDIKELKGACACPGKASGTVKIVNEVSEISKLSEGEIMLSHATYPGLVPAMKKASAIVTDEGGLASHAAIVSRELGVPCIVGTRIGTKIFQDGCLVEVDATKGIIRRS